MEYSAAGSTIKEKAVKVLPDSRRRRKEIINPLGQEEGVGIVGKITGGGGKEEARQALTSIQKSGNPGENEMVGRIRKASDISKSEDKPGPAPKPTAINKVRNGSIAKRKHADKGIQTVNPDIELITGDEPPLVYWKELAETRRQALEESLRENQTLHERIDDLEKENRLLEDMVEQAKHLAEFITNISDDDNDESGLGLDTTEDPDCSTAF